MATVPVASHKAFLGIAKETTKGTAVASSAYIPFTPGTLKYTPGRTLIEDKGARGAPGDVYGHVAGVEWSEVSWGGQVYVDVIGWILAGLFGEEAYTATPSTHTFTALNSGQQQPPAYTLNPYYAVANRQIPGAQFSELNVTWTADGDLTYTTKAVGFPSAVATKPTPSFTAVPPLAAWNCNISINGSPSADVLSGNVSIKRNASRIHVAGPSAPANVWAGALTIDGKLQLVMESDTEMGRLLTPGATQFNLNWQPDANNEFALLMSKVQYTAAEPELGKDWVELPITFMADLNTTDVGSSGGYGPGKAIIVNAVGTGVYT